jgi:hypothetical protein
MELNLPSGVVCEAPTADQDAIDRLVAHHWNPGDKVRLVNRRTAAVRSELFERSLQSISALASAAGLKELTVKELILTDTHHVEHTFAEIEGRWNAGLVRDLRDIQSLYGCFVEKDGAIWFARFKELDVIDADATPFKLAPTVERLVAREIGISSLADLAGLAGEAHIAAEADGTYSLAYAPWTSDASETEKASALEAVERATAAAMAPSA